MLRAVASRCRRIAASSGGPRTALRWTTPVRDFAVSAPEESSSARAPRDSSRDSRTASPASLRPAILVCTSKVVSAATRKDYEAWLVDGKRLIEEVLRDKDCQAGLSLGDEENVQHRFSWVHFPAPSSVRTGKLRGELAGSRPPVDVDASDETSSHARKRLTRAGGGASATHVRHSGAPECETVAVVFQRHDDLERWRHSRRRAAWLESGERFGGDDGSGERGSLSLSARATSIDVDDGSLGGWLPADAGYASRETGGDEKKKPKQNPSPSAWKVWLAVLLAQYPLVEANALLVLPAIDAMELGFVTTAPQPLKMFVVQSWTSFAAVFITLPLAQAGLRRTGFLEENRLGGTSAVGVSSVAAAYAAVVAVAYLAQPHAAAAVAALAKTQGT